MHCGDLAGGVCDRDADRRDVERSSASAAAQFVGVERPFERILCDTDHLNLLVHCVVEILSETWMELIVQPNVSVDHNAGRRCWKHCQNGFDAWQFSQVELTGLVVADIREIYDVLGHRRGIAPVVDDHAGSDRRGRIDFDSV